MTKNIKGCPNQEEIDSLCEGFQFNYPGAFIVEKEKNPFRLKGFGSWDPDKEQVQFQLIILGANPKTFRYHSTLIYSSSGNQIKVKFNDANPFSGVPHGTNCTLSIQINPIDGAIMFLNPDFNELIRKKMVPETIAFMEAIKETAVAETYFFQLNYLSKNGTDDQKKAAAFLLQKIFKTSAKPNKAIYEYNLPLVLAAAPDREWNWEEPQNVDGDHGDVAIAIGTHTPSSRVYLRTITSLAFPENMIAVYLKPTSKIPAFFIALTKSNNEKIGQINLSDLLYLSVITDQFIKAPGFWIKPFSLSEMNSNLKHLIANSWKSSSEDLDAIFKSYYEHNQ